MAAITQYKGIILSVNELEGYSYLDLGKALADALQQENPASPVLPFKAYDAVKQIFTEQMHQEADGTEYVAVKNFNILFEPSLRINLRNIVEDYAKRCILILKLNTRLTKGGTYYPFPGNTTYSLELANLPVPIHER